MNNHCKFIGIFYIQNIIYSMLHMNCVIRTIESWSLGEQKMNNSKTVTHLASALDRSSTLSCLVLSGCLQN